MALIWICFFDVGAWDTVTWPEGLICTPESLGLHDQTAMSLSTAAPELRTPRMLRSYENGDCLVIFVAGDSNSA